MNYLLAATDAQIWHSILVIAAIVLFVYGVVTIVRGAVLYGVILIILALLVGPGGVSILS